MLPAPLKAEVQARWEPATQLEILAVIGYYGAICYFANHAEIGLEPGAPRFADYGADAAIRRDACT